MPAGESLEVAAAGDAQGLHVSATTLGMTLSSMPWARSSCLARTPIVHCFGWPTASRRPGAVRSAIVAMPFGLPLGTAIATSVSEMFVSSWNRPPTSVPKLARAGNAAAETEGEEREKGAAAAAQEVVNVQFDGAAGIVDLQLLQDGGKIVSAFAVETQRNTPWLAKTDQLTVAADGRITGTLSLTQTPDLLALQALRRDKNANKDAKAPPVLTEEVALDVTPKGGKVEGTVKAAVAKNALLGKADAVAVRGSVYPQAPATESLIELVPFGVNSSDRSAMESGELRGGLIVRMSVRGSKVERSNVFVPPGPGVQFGTSFEVPALVGQAIVEGNKLKGAITLTRADKSPVEGILGFEGTIIGDYAVGLATWESGGVTEEGGWPGRDPKTGEKLWPGGVFGRRNQDGRTRPGRLHVRSGAAVGGGSPCVIRRQPAIL